ncbi:MAG: RHS repeat-associated core domain-containing protein [Clostridia bacterium]|nr:RHS repeat-associated core domain-containing protein [Clostridia bacterium]
MFGSNYNVVDLTENSVVNVGSIHESTASNVSTYSTSSTTSTLYTIGSDAIGNPTSYLGNSLTWFCRQLTGYNSNITYTYDTDGYRASKTVNGETTTYQYVNGMLIYECRPDMEIFYLYDSYSNLTGIRLYYNGSETEYNYYVATNVQGDVVGIYRYTGELLASYEYDAWGNVLSVTDANGNPITSETHIANINPFRYRGYYLDNETGLYYLNSRYYNAEVGRFISADTTDILSVKADLYDKNLFAYCDNNPIVRADYGGDFWHIVAGAAIGGLFELGGQLLSGEEVNWAKVGVATLTSGITVASGPFIGALISGATNVILDVMSGETNVKKLAISGTIGAGASLLGSGIGKIVERVGGKVATKVLSKMSKSNLKKVVTSLESGIKGVERNMIKNISFLTSNYPNIGKQYFMNSQLGKLFTTAIEQISEGLAGIGANYGRARCFL